ncbi:hypothetical protein BCR34DRAFT_554339 [Clohesyomyces aquaticus]|uniref:Zn(2)-C6 fungal-type domain-containing protein n=1 Tax=Clohesyomyces aquaticus TaxID=1231657 RepID=A0A1Y2A768_9PLEO|nr:hypothetical protein BCR34DRAFT_554339 [Clohesyomyces aquaticus]
MEDIEEPAARQARTLQACLTCRSQKTRCVPSERAGTCRKCFSSKRECVWPETQRRKQRVRGPSRISQVEKKIDSLAASLIEPNASKQTHTPSGPTATASPILQNEPHRPERPLAPGSWLPFPSSFAEVESNDRDRETSQDFLEKIRKIHTFTDDNEPRQQPHNLFQGSSPHDPEVDHDIVKGLLSSGEAENLLKEYRAMSESFPFVPLPVAISALELSLSKPMLLLAILTVASWKDHKRQRSLDKHFRTQLANRTIIRPRRTVSLVQSIIVYLSWYHFVFSHKTHQVFSLIQLAIGVALDIGIHQRSTHISFDFPGRPKPPAQSPAFDRERQRTFLGCYYLSSVIAGGLHKPNLLKYTDYMAESCQRLKSDAEYVSDERIGQLIALRRIDDQIHDSLFTEDAACLPITDSRISMNLRFAESQIDEWKRETRGVEYSRALDLSYSFARLQLHSVGLRPLPPSLGPSSASPVQLNSLLSALEAGKSSLDSLLDLPASDYHLLSFPEWMRLPFVVMTVAKLCIPSDAHNAAQWDVKAAQDRVRLDLCLESLCYRMHGLSTFQRPIQPHPDFWWAMKMIMDLTRAWYCRKIRGGNAPVRQVDSHELLTPSTTTYNGQSSAGNTGVYQTPSTMTDGPNECQRAGFMDGHLSFDNGNHDTFAFMQDPNFEMDQFFDIGIWSTGTYEELGFGGGNMGF